MEKDLNTYFAQNNQFIMTILIVQRMLSVLVVLGGHPENIVIEILGFCRIILKLYQFIFGQKNMSSDCCLALYKWVFNFCWLVKLARLPIEEIIGKR